MTRHRQAGLSLLEVLLSLSLISVGMVGVNRLVDSYVVDTKNAAVADQLKTSAQAYRAYVRNNYSTILAVATQDKPYLVTHTDLSLGNYLPPGSNGRTVYGQTICALVRKNNAGSLEALVVTEGGAALNNLDLGSIVSLTGGSAGALYSDDKADTTPADIVGAQGSWKLPLAQFDNLVNHAGKNCDGKDQARVRITEGHPVVALWFENDFTQGSALYRDAVPGAPQLNQMNTPLVMNSVQVAGNLCSERGAIARDASGLMQTCSIDPADPTQLRWTRVASDLAWASPVATVAALPACSAAILGQVRLVNTFTAPALAPSAYVCTGQVWQPLGADISGNLRVPGQLSANTLRPTAVVTKGSSCTGSGAGTLAVDQAGTVLACRSGANGSLLWREILSTDSATPAKNVEFKHCTNSTSQGLQKYLCELPLDSNSHWVVSVSGKMFVGYESYNSLYVDDQQMSTTSDRETDSQESYSHYAVLSKSCGSGPCSVKAELRYGNGTYQGFATPTLTVIAFRVDGPK